jgi:hypothetical protein
LARSRRNLAPSITAQFAQDAQRSYVPMTAVRDGMSSQTPQIQVVHKRHQQRFEVRMDDDVSFLSYTFDGNQVLFDHTYVPARFRGKGIAAALARAALHEAREHQWRIIPQCSYVALFIERNPEYADLVAS